MYQPNPSHSSPRAASRIRLISWLTPDHLYTNTPSAWMPTLPLPQQQCSIQAEGVSPHPCRGVSELASLSRLLVPKQSWTLERLLPIPCPFCSPGTQPHPSTFTSGLPLASGSSPSWFLLSPFPKAHLTLLHQVTTKHSPTLCL